ncbi:hypothetical protein [Rarobacter incanus]|nr:hypothetical protein [Rarobacter incanus]
MKVPRDGLQQGRSMHEIPDVLRHARGATFAVFAVNGLILGL